jgi:hypothetical protein
VNARRIRVPERTRAVSGLPEPDYACAFRSAHPPTDTRSAEQWARVVFEGASRPVRLFLTLGWRIVLGLRLGPYPSADHVLGWRIGASEPGLIVLDQRSRLITAHNVVEVDGASICWTTFVKYRHPAAPAVWALVKPFHVLTIPRLLRRAGRHAA